VAALHGGAFAKLRAIDISNNNVVAVQIEQLRLRMRA
jgi:hypothetical protein